MYQKAVDALIENGAVVMLLPPYPEVMMILAGAIFQDNPTRLRWCAIWPEHQGHIHTLYYDEIKVYPDNSMAIYKGGGLMMCISPYQRSPMAGKDALAAIVAWKNHQAYPGKKEEFANFLAYA